MKIVCLGDSLTYGFGCSRNKIWTKLAQEKSGYEIINKGINGDTTGGMLARFYHDVVLNKPDIVLIIGSTNDLAAGADLGVVKANIMAMVHQAFYNGIIPVVGTLLKADLENIPKHWENFAQYTKMNFQMFSYREWIYDFSSTFNVRVLDLYHEFESRIEPSEYKNCYLDGVHFNSKGHQLMSDIFVEYMKLMEKEIKILK